MNDTTPLVPFHIELYGRLYKRPAFAILLLIVPNFKFCHSKKKNAIFPILRYTL